MKKELKVETDPETGDGFINIEEFKDLLDISKISSYSLDPILDENKKPTGIRIGFFDSNGTKLQFYKEK